MTAMRIKIKDRWIGEKEPVFVVAEAGVNHNGNMNLAKKLIDYAVEAGADAVKFQSFKTESVITKNAPSAQYHIRATGGRETWFELLKRLELKEEEHFELLNYCNEKGIIFFSTPYDEESADFLNKIGIPVFKVASTDLNNIPLLKRITSYAKPIFLSTGMSNLVEVRESVEVILRGGNEQIVLLQCTANYPPRVEDANLNVIEAFKKEFNLLVGYSDHLTSSQAAIAAIAKGACVYEVHYTLDRNLPGPDQRSSMEPRELKQVIMDIRLTEKVLGSFIKEVTPSEEETRDKLRKSIVANKDIKAGDKLTEQNIGIKRPGSGLPPKFYYSILGKISKRNIAKDELIRFEDLSDA